MNRALTYRALMVCAATLLISSTSWAQGGFVSADLGYQFGTEGFRADAPLVDLPEGSNLLVGYPVGDSGMIDGGGGYLFTPNLGVGVTGTYTQRGWVAVLQADVVLPDGLGIVRTKPGFEEVDRSEFGLHFQVVGVLPVSDRLQVSFYGGPSWIRVSQDMVSSLVAGDETLEGETTPVDGSAIGFNVGGDVTYFFTDTLGIGGGVRYTRATVELDDPIGTEVSGAPSVAESRAGGAQAVAGIRFRFR